MKTFLCAVQYSVKCSTLWAVVVQGTATGPHRQNPWTNHH